MPEGNSWGMPQREANTDSGPARGPNPNRIPWNQRGNAPESPRKKIGEAASKVNEFLSSIPIRNAFSNLSEKFSARKPNIAEMAVITKKTVQNLGEKRVFGQKLSDMLADAAVGAVAAGTFKTGLKIATSMTGVGVVEMAILGAAGGGISGVAKEYMRQRRNYNETTYQANLVGELKHKLKIKDGRAIAMAGLKGAAMGAVGGVAANTVISLALENEWIQEQVAAASKAVVGAVRETASSGATTAKSVWENVKSIPGQTIKSVEVQLPQINMPKVELPEIKAPEIRLPQVPEQVNQVQQSFGESSTATAAPTASPEAAQAVAPQPASSPAPAKMPEPAYAPPPAPASAPIPSETPASVPGVEPSPAPATQVPQTGQVIESSPDTAALETPSPAQPQTPATGISGETPAQPPDGTLQQPPAPESQLQIPENIASAPDEVLLEKESNIWDTTAKYLESIGVEPTNQNVFKVSFALAERQGFKVPEWGLMQGVDARMLPPGEPLKFGLVKDVITKIAQK